MLIDGKWTSDWHPFQAKDGDGRFVRQTSAFRDCISTGDASDLSEDGRFPFTPGRYRLYVALICPWASRALIARKLKGLEDAIPVTVVEPFLSEQGWRFGDFPGADHDPLFGADHLHELYTRADPHYTGRATVPVLWDTGRDTILNNESADIVKMFDELGPERPKLRPAGIVADIDALNSWLYDQLNNGVYRAGFASSQAAYEEAVQQVFDALDTLEARLAKGGPWLFGPQLTETDIRLFVTAIRFDLAYHGLFKTNLRRLSDYPAISSHMARFLALPGVAETVSVDHIKHGYYSIKALNPSGIVPLGPASPMAGRAPVAG